MRGSYDGVRLHNHRLFTVVAPVLTLQAPEWTVDALCAQVDPALFFPEAGGDTRPAKRICATCPVRVPCLQYALDQDDAFGVYGGMSPRERRRLRRSGSGAP